MNSLINVPQEKSLYPSILSAGSSYGIFTEFLYKIYEQPETLPCLVFIFIENKEDIRNLEKAAVDGRFQFTISLPQFLRDITFSSDNMVRVYF